jgi:hypothetical protein
MSFVFGVTAALASAVTELSARFIGLRGAYLLSGLRELVDGGERSTDLTNAEADYMQMQNLIRGPIASQAQPPSVEPYPAPPSVTGALLGGPILGNQGVAGQISSRKLTLAPTTGTGRLPKMKADRMAGRLYGGETIGGRLWSQRRSLPSYISAKSFAEAVIDLLVPDAAGQTTIDTIQYSVYMLPVGLPFRSSLQALLKNADGDVSRFRTDVEYWYDDHMDRVSGWYKRHVAKITLVIGAILIMLLNINALTIGRTLYSDSAVSTAVSKVAAKGADCSASPTRQECLANLQGQLSAVAAAGLPIGWGIVRDCRQPQAQCNWLDQRGVFSRHGNSGWQLALVLVGFLITIIAIVPGARFWFDLLGRLGSLRQTGPKPAPPPS